MKTVIILIICAVNGFSLASDQWIKQNTPVNSWLNKCTFSDSLHGWAAGSDGVIISTSNGGINWVRQYSPVNFYIYDIQALNSRLIWGVANDSYGKGTAVFSTTNGGINWNMFRYPDTTQFFYAVCFRDSLNGWLGGYMGTFARTSNGGINWLIVHTDSSSSSDYPIYHISFVNSETGFACGGYIDMAGVIWKTTNNGINWVSRLITPEPLFDIEVLNPELVIISGGDFEFGASCITTTNSGANWNYELLNNFGIGYGLSFRTSSEGWMTLGIGEGFMTTTNSGQNWNRVHSSDTSYLYDIVFPDESHGWAVGQNGAILKFNPETIGIKQNHEEETTDNYFLYQNYPNPFNSSTEIKFYIPERPGKYSQHIRLSVYDILGHEKVLLADSPMNTGTHKVSWNAENFSSGIYFYVLKVSDPSSAATRYSESRKMILIK
jgi:photosystem II stability/assembly factor-like uncharacterized protein